MMPFEALFTRLLAAVTLVIAVSMFVPTAAQAHPGHGPGAAPAASSVSARATRTVAVAKAATPKHVASQADIVCSASVLSCTAGCCGSMGTGCCAAWVAPPNELHIPLAGGNLAIPISVGGTGVQPGALPEPPRTIV